MSRALTLAERGRFTAHPNPRVGCVLVAAGKVVAEGWHQRTGEPHAEAVALAQAGSAASGATAYVTLEPCCHTGRTPPCAAALVAAGVRRVVTGAGDPNPAVSGRGLQELREAGIEVRSGVLEEQCRALIRGFESRMVRGRPFVRSKLAVSIDGRTALASGESQWITSAASRADVQRLRAESGAILSGIGTVLADDPSLNVRDDSLGVASQPMRVIADSTLRISPDARLLSLPGSTLIAAGKRASSARSDALSQGRVAVEVFPGAGGGVDLRALLRRLGEMEINDVLVEAGPRLNGALLEAGLIDEIVVFQAPHVLGSGAQPMFAFADLDSMAKRHELELTELRHTGTDLKMTYSLKTSGRE